jgi:hypothetical protein
VHTNGILEMLTLPDLPDYLQNGLYSLTDPNFVFIDGCKCIDLNDRTLITTDKNKILVIFFSDSNFGNIPFDLHDKIKTYLLNFLILSSDSSHHLQKSNLVYHPFYYYFLKNVLKDQAIGNNRINRVKRRYKVCCLNGTPRPHRIYNYLVLKNKSYYDDCFFSIHTDPVNIKNNRGDEPLLPNNIITEWDNVSANLPMFGDTNICSHHIDLSHPAYRNSYINLVTETTVAHNFFISEKTWKPIAAGQLFLLFSCAGSVEHLRGYGIDTFDDIINHDYYDIEPDPFKRMFKLHEILDDLVKENLHEIFIKTHNRRKKNMELFYNIDLGKRYTNDIQQLVQNIKNV